MVFRSNRPCIVLLLALASFTAAHAQRPGIVGRAAPEWNVETWYNLPSGRDSLDIADLEGKVVFVLCFQSWCPGCHSHGFPTLQALTRHFADADDVAFVAIQTVFEGFSSNTVDDGKRTMDDYGLTIPWAQTEGRDHQSPPFMRAYRTGGTPWVVLIDPEGTVRFDGFGIEADQAIRAIEHLRPSRPAAQADLP